MEIYMVKNYSFVIITQKMLNSIYLLVSALIELV